MADLSITAANVKAGANATTADGIAGATITAGQAVYPDPVSGKLLLAQTDTAGSSNVAGIALHGASDDQPIKYQTAGNIDLGVTLSVGETYVLSETAGGIQPVTIDLGVGEYVTVIGIGEIANRLILSLRVTGAANA